MKRESEKEVCLVQLLAFCTTIMALAHVSYFFYERTPGNGGHLGLYLRRGADLFIHYWLFIFTSNDYQQSRFSYGRKILHAFNSLSHTIAIHPKLRYLTGLPLMFYTDALSMVISWLYLLPNTLFSCSLGTLTYAILRHKDLIC